MSSTIVLKSGRPHASLPGVGPLLAGFFRIFQFLLMGAGLLLIIAVIDSHRGGGLVMEGLQDFLMPEATSEARISLSSSQEADPLTPRMRSALEFVSRRYRVSGEALEPIFVAAETSASAVRVDPLLVVAVIAVESRFNPFSESVFGAQGLMQVVPRFHQDKLPGGADELSFLDPVINVRIGTRILKEYIVRHGGLVAGLQQFAGAADDPVRRYATRVLAEKNRLEAAVQRQNSAGA